VILILSWWLIFWVNTQTHEHGQGPCIWDNKADAELMANTASERGPIIYSVRECEPTKATKRSADKRQR
jgi:hypothetical protein